MSSRGTPSKQAAKAGLLASKIAQSFSPIKKVPSLSSFPPRVPLLDFDSLSKKKHTIEELMQLREKVFRSAVANGHVIEDSSVVREDEVEISYTVTNIETRKHYIFYRSSRKYTGPFDKIDFSFVGTKESLARLSLATRSNETLPSVSFIILDGAVPSGPVSISPPPSLRGLNGDEYSRVYLAGSIRLILDTYCLPRADDTVVKISTLEIGAGNVEIFCEENLSITELRISSEESTVSISARRFGIRTIVLGARPKKLIFLPPCARFKVDRDLEGVEVPESLTYAMDLEIPLRIAVTAEINGKCKVLLC